MCVFLCVCGGRGRAKFTPETIEINEFNHASTPHTRARVFVCSIFGIIEFYCPMVKINTQIESLCVCGLNAMRKMVHSPFQVQQMATQYYVGIAHIVLL